MEDVNEKPTQVEKSNTESDRILSDPTNQQNPIRFLVVDPLTDSTEEFYFLIAYELGFNRIPIVGSDQVQ